MLRVALDHAARYELVLAHGEGAPMLRLVRSGADRLSLLGRSLEANLRATTDRGDARFDPLLGAISLPRGATRAAVGLGGGDDAPLFALTLAPEPRLDGAPRALTPFETRFLADNGSPHPAPRAPACAPPALVTDLHTHFAGCVRPDDLLAIGLEADVAYPAGLLAEAGIRVEQTDRVALRDLSPELLGVLARRLSVPLDRQVPFVEMERIYRLRAPVTKSLAAFPALCRRIARDYAAMGVTYVELSLSNVVEAAWLSAIHREVPAIEEETGTRLRFLAALSRHDDLEWDLDVIDRMKEIASSRFFVGVDFMGHERNSTRAFARQIREIARWADADRPGFTVRVHAGENPAHPENVRVAAECVEGARVALRIGHGLYGLDERTIDALRRANATVEFNLNSNLALNNIQTTRDVPLARYLDAGIPAVLGTDGYGIYGSTLPLELATACVAGLSAEGARLLAESERRYLDGRERADAGAPSAAAFVVKPDPPLRHYTPEIAARKRTEEARRDAALAARLAALGVPVLDGERVLELARGRDVISFGGAWRKSWELVSAPMRARVATELAAFFDALDAARTLLITGGTCHGLEGVVHALARPRGFAVLGALVKETPPDSLAEGAITHATLLGTRLHDKAAGLYTLLARVDGLAVFIGGGGIVSDEIQTAANLGVRHLLMNGPEGASTEHARQRPELAFTSAEELLARRRFVSTNDPYWHLGANPTVDVVLARDGAAGPEVLLIRRAQDAASEPGRWALPGGFQLTSAPRGTPFVADVETLEEAALRELREETGLDLTPLAARLLPFGIYEGNGRDPRDTERAWSRSHAFALDAGVRAGVPIAGGDDAEDARWFAASSLPSPLAFDHARILADGLARLGLTSEPGRRRRDS